MSIYSYEENKTLYSSQSLGVTEELAELHAIIQAIEYERRSANAV